MCVFSPLHIGMMPISGIVYFSWVPSDVHDTGLPPGSASQKHAYEPSILVKSQLSPRSSHPEITEYEDLSQFSELKRVPVRR